MENHADGATALSEELRLSDQNVEIWRVRRLLKSLETARGNGTSMISLIIPSKGQIARVSKMLADEFGTASNIKCRVNRASVLDAITSVRQKLKLYHSVPDNGLAIYWRHSKLKPADHKLHLILIWLHLGRFKFLPFFHMNIQNLFDAKKKLNSWWIGTKFNVQTFLHGMMVSSNPHIPRVATV